MKTPFMLNDYLDTVTVSTLERYFTKYPVIPASATNSVHRWYRGGRGILLYLCQSLTKEDAIKAHSEIVARLSLVPKLTTTAVGVAKALGVEPYGYWSPNGGVLWTG